MPLLESMLLSVFLLTPVEIGSFNASPRLQRKKECNGTNKKYNTRYDLNPGPSASNPSMCHIFKLFRCILSFSATLAKRWKVQFRLGLAKKHSTTLILITADKYQKRIRY